MNKKEKNGSRQFFYASKILLIGLLVAQILSTLHVYFSNIEFYNHTLRIIEAGFVAVPNAQTLPQAKTFVAAFSGGLFFTLTIGCFLSLVTMAYMWVWRRFFYKKYWALIPGAMGWGISLWMVNERNFLPMVTAYFLIIPVLVGWATLKRAPIEEGTGDKKTMLFGCLTFILLVAVGIFNVDNRIFIDFRDNILLSNPMGIKVNDGYYKYTLYPAEIIKPFEKKLLKTCRLENIKNNVLAYQLEKSLLRYDYLPISDANADLTLSNTGDTLVFMHQQKVILSTPLKYFHSRPYLFLKEFSDKTDDCSFFRRTIFISLLAGLPIGVYVLVFGGVQFIVSFVSNRRTASVAASIICMCLGLGLMFSLQSNKTPQKENQSIDDRLASADKYIRTAAIKDVFQNKQDITQFAITETHLKSPYIPERYWLAMALSTSPGKKAEPYLIELLDDPSVNVKCKVYYALSKTKQRAYIPLFLRELKKSDHLYVQLYAYNALKELGWTQTKLH